MKRLFNLIILAVTVAMTSCGGGEKAVETALGKIENMAQLAQ
jgi:hypothetical protein